MFGITGLIALGAAWMSIVVVAQTINGTSTGLVGEFCNDVRSSLATTPKLCGETLILKSCSTTCHSTFA
jgi:hypothetical protein